jgi:hypothetical protein
MIRIFLGNVGSGKTACYVRELAINPSHRNTYCNIHTTQLQNVKKIKPDMLIKKEVIGYKKDGEEKLKLTFNKEFWQKTKKKEKAINVCLDEAHTLLDARRSQSTRNLIMGDFMAMLRRILGQTEAGYGDLTLITQLSRRIDIIAREMASQVRYHRCHYLKSCKYCGITWQEHNDEPEPFRNCISCSSPHILKHSHTIEVWHFGSMDHYEAWVEYGQKSYHWHYFVRDIEKYFKYYNTEQWEDLFSEYGI